MRERDRGREEAEGEGSRGGKRTFRKTDSERQHGRPLLTATERSSSVCSQATHMQVPSMPFWGLTV